MGLLKRSDRSPSSPVSRHVIYIRADTTGTEGTYGMGAFDARVLYDVALLSTASSCLAAGTSRPGWRRRSIPVHERRAGVQVRRPGASIAATVCHFTDAMGRRRQLGILYATLWGVERHAFA